MSRYLSDDCSCDDEVVEERCSCGSRNVVGVLNGSDCCEACWPSELEVSNRRKAAHVAKEQARVAAAERDADWKALAGL